MLKPDRTTSSPVDPKEQAQVARKNLGKRLAAIRMAQSWTQDYLAQRLEVDQGTISRWERGGKVRPPRAVLAVYAFLQGCTFEGLTRPVVSYEDHDFSALKRTPDDRDRCLAALVHLGLLVHDPKVARPEGNLRLALTRALTALNSYSAKEREGRLLFDSNIGRVQHLRIGCREVITIRELSKSCILVQS
jgi:transcriptional regulator with XRE-family HTH domain